MKKIPAILALVAVFGFGLTPLFATPTLGQPAPPFTLKDTEGKEHSLADYKGQVVVLEWTNHGCPFVIKHYASQNMQKQQAEATAKGVIWLTICSSAPGQQGHMTAEEAAAKLQEVGAKATAYLLDEDGRVGKLYQAKRTPEMFVINEEGILVYKGAIDDNPSPDQATVAGAKNYVAAALEEILAGKPVTTPETKAYGCSVKYAK